MKGETLANLSNVALRYFLALLPLLGHCSVMPHFTSLPLWLVFGWHGFSIPTMSMG